MAIPSTDLIRISTQGPLSECATVQQQWPNQWLMESANVFRMFMPDAAGN